jgi:hypothetical protein
LSWEAARRPPPPPPDRTAPVWVVGLWEPRRLAGMFSRSPS